MQNYWIKSKISAFFAAVCVTVFFASCDFNGGGSQVEEPWARSYEYNNDTGSKILHAGDGGFIYLTKSGLLMKLNKSGEILWQKSYDIWKPVVVQETASGDIIAAGPQHETDVSWSNKFIIMKLNNEGNVVWAKKYVSDNKQEILGISCDNINNSIILAGNNYYWNLENNLFTRQWARKLDSNGNILWEKMFGANYSIYAWSYMDVKITSDGGFIQSICLEKSSLDPNYSTVITKMGSSGGLEWSKTYGASTLPHSIEESADGGYMVLGQGSEADAACIWIMKLDSAGNKLWAETLNNVTGGYNFGEDYPGGSMLWAQTEYRDYPLSIKVTSDGGCVVMGDSTKTTGFVVGFLRYGLSYYAGWMIKLDTQGKISWQKEYADKTKFKSRIDEGGMLAYIYYNSIKITSFDVISEGGYILAGSLNRYPNYPYYAILLRTDVDGNIPDTNLRIKDADATTGSIDITVENISMTQENYTGSTVTSETVNVTNLDPGFVTTEI